MPAQQPGANSKPFVLGITGSIASGKSIVGKILTSMGITVIDTDILVHDLLSEDQTTKKAIVEQFGTDVLDMGKTVNTSTAQNNDRSQPWVHHPIDRKKLGQIVFANEGERKKLEKIVHPNTILALRKRLSELAGQPLVAVLVPLLFESKLQSEYDEVWTIYTDEGTLRQRLRERDNLTESEIDSRLQAQMPQQEKIKLANQVIDNSFSAAETERQVKLLVEKILPTGSHC
jgi:dephospho-CoA kinase